MIELRQYVLVIETRLCPQVQNINCLLKIQVNHHSLSVAYYQ